MGAQHTPGPWRIVIDGTCSAAWPHILGVQHDDDCIDSVAELGAVYLERSRRGFPATFTEKPRRFRPTDDHDRVMADARLIAAAPELLALLSLLIKRWEYDHGDDLPRAVVEARVVIAKAEGAGA